MHAGAGWELAAQPHVSFTQQPSPRGRPIWVPDRLPRLEVARALAVVELPLHLNWSAPGRVFDLRSRADRARVYEIVLQEGRPADILAYVDGALLADLWDELVLPRAVRSQYASFTDSRGRGVVSISRFCLPPSWCQSNRNGMGTRIGGWISR